MKIRRSKPLRIKKTWYDSMGGNFGRSKRKAKRSQRMIDIFHM